jgi:salicylate hydroxylase
LTLIIGQDPVVIAGAGIGGLTAALMLGRRGAPVLVLERRTVLEETGAGIQLSPNASRVMVDLGLSPALARQSVTPERIDIRAARSGRQLARVPLGEEIAQRHQGPYWVIHRAALHTVLLDAVRALPNVRLLVGREVVAAAQDQAGVNITVRAGNGVTETIRAPLLIGADGVRSKVRAALGDERSPRYRGSEAWRGICPIEAAPDFAQTARTGLWLGPGFHVVHYPIAAGRILNVVAIVEADSPRDGWNDPGESHRLKARLGTLAPDLAGIVAAPHDWRIWSLFDLPTRVMAKGRIALLGDAAHPILPFLAQGGALAIEDAATLTELVAAAPDAVPTALGAYERLRLKRVRRVQDEARGNGRIYHMGLPLSLARDAALAARSPTSLARRYDWLYGWKIDLG